MTVRVFIGLSDICGYYTQLERGFEAAGVSCTFVNAYPSRDYERVSRPGRIGRFVEWAAKHRVDAPRGTLRRRIWSAVQGVGLVLLLGQALAAFDVFIFSGGITFLFQRDLWLLKLLKKKVIVVFHGSDSRPPYLNAAYVGTDGPLNIDDCVRLARRVKEHVSTVERYADVVVNHSMSSHFHERRLVNWLHIGIPYEVASEVPTRRPSANSEVVIVHAPTRPGPKGTPQIEHAISSLRQKGHQIRFVKLVDRPHADVLKELAQSDFIVDELFSDTTMASFAAEAAAFGKPAVVGMHGYEELQRYTTADVIPPAMVCRPDEVEAAIERLVVDREYRVELGRRARQFLVEHWAPERVASRFVRLASGDVPAEWWFDPNTIAYLHGWGMSDIRARQVIQTIVEHRGASALLVADKPALQDALVDFGGARADPAVRALD